MRFLATLVLIFALASNAFALVSTAPVTAQLQDGSGNSITSTSSALDINIKSGSTTLGAGSNLVGKVGIDQTTPGTTNGVQINAAIPSGTNLMGKVGIDQTTPGTTNGVQINAAIPAGANLIGKTGIDQTTPGTTNKVAISDGSGSNFSGANPLPVTSSFSTRADTFTTTSNGTTVDVHLAPLKSFTLSVKATGSVTSWTVVLECSLDNTNFTTVLTHTNVTPGDGVAVFSGTSLAPCMYFRSRSSAITLGAGTNVIATILGM